MNYDVIVIGGGPAGLIAAAEASKRGNTTLLIDSNKILAKKLRITGKGRCNITNTADQEDFLNSVNTNPQFLYSSIYSFFNNDIIELLNQNGVKTKIERGGRVFPESDKAHDVAEALINNAKKNNVTFLTNKKVKKILSKNKKITGVLTTDGEKIQTNKIILATGGLSYPLTGSDGSGYKLASELGHTIINPKAALVPLKTKETFVKKISGLTLKNIAIKIEQNNKIIYNDFGEMLFTHFGVSGPVILSASSHIKYFPCKLIIDLKPALTEEQLDKRICRDFSEVINKNFSNSLNSLLPKSLIEEIIILSEIDVETKVNQITKEQRRHLVKLLKNLSLTITGPRPIDEAIVTSGGIAVKEINPSTMQSKLVDGLSFAGEIIDVDAYTGGFNLQIAYSTGFLAGKHI